MSLYCKGNNCKRHLGCMRFHCWERFYETYHQETSPGLWFINEEDCVKNNYEDIV